MASVRRLKPEDLKSPWVVEYTNPDTGKRVRKTPKSGLKKDAEALRRKIEGEIDRGDHVAVRDTATVAEATAAWLKDCEKRAQIGDRMTRSTVAMYATCAKRLTALIGAIKLTDLGAKQLQDFADDLSEELSPVSVKHTFVALGLVYDHAISTRQARRNAVKDHKTRLPGSTRRVVIPTRGELQRILDAARERMPGELKQAQAVRYAAVCIGLFGGLRRGEVCGLKWDCVDLDRGVIQVRRSLSRLDGLKVPKTRAGNREVPIVPQMRAAIEALGSERAPDTFVLTSTRHGTPIAPNDLTNLYWRLVCKKAGLADAQGRPRYKLHTLRHAAASLYIAQGLSPLHVKNVIGHASVNTTLNIYGHLFPEDAAIGNAARDIAQQFNAT